jgi:hypothetical protein
VRRKEQRSTRKKTQGKLLKAAMLAFGSIRSRKVEVTPFEPSLKPSFSL